MTNVHLLVACMMAASLVLARVSSRATIEAYEHAVRPDRQRMPSRLWKDFFIRRRALLRHVAWVWGLLLVVPAGLLYATFQAETGGRIPATGNLAYIATMATIWPALLVTMTAASLYVAMIDAFRRRPWRREWITNFVGTLIVAGCLVLAFSFIPADYRTVIGTWVPPWHQVGPFAGSEVIERAPLNAHYAMVVALFVLWRTQASAIRQSSTFFRYVLPREVGPDDPSDAVELAAAPSAPAPGGPASA